MKAVLYILALLSFSHFSGISAGSQAYALQKKNSSAQKKVSPGKNDSSAVYIVKKGETLYKIARDHETTPAQLTSANSLKNGEIYAGMKLRIPGPANEKNTSPYEETTAAHESVSNNIFMWPVSPVLSVGSDSEKGVKQIGVFIRSKSGTPVLSASSGKVEKVGRMRGYGNFVVIRHSNGMVSVYSGLENIKVKEGIAVKKGGSLGYLEESNPRLHFMIHKGGKPEDPLKILPAKKA